MEDTTEENEDGLPTATDIAKWSATKLRTECRKLSLETQGARRDMIRRLLKYLQEEKKAKKISANSVTALLCPISKELMVDPVFCHDGYNYERECMQGWYDESPDQNKVKSPMTLLMMKKIPLATNNSYTAHLEYLIDNNVIRATEPAVVEYKSKQYRMKLEQRASNNNAAALLELGSNYMVGTNGYGKNPKKAVKFFTKATLLENVVATASLAECMLKGIGIEQRNVEGIMRATEAACNGSDHACYLLAMANANGSNDLPVNVREATKWLTKCTDGTCKSKTLVAELKNEARVLLQKLTDQQQNIVALD